MSSYLVTGASRGIGFEFIRQLSADPANVVVAMVRDKATAEKKITDEIGASNITVVEGDITDGDGLKAAVDIVSKTTSGKLDYLIANAGKISDWSGFDDVGDLANADPKLLDQDMTDLFRTNVVGNAHLFNAFLPLIRNGSAKKVIAISSGMGDRAMTSQWKVTVGYPYSISKSALNMLVAKFQAQYVDEGILFLAVCPGTVDTRAQPDLSAKQLENFMSLAATFKAYQPNFTGQAKPSEAVADVLKVMYNASVEKDAGGFVSHFGNKQWL